MRNLCRCYEQAARLQKRVLDDHDLSDAAKLMFCRLMLSCACGWGYAQSWNTDQVDLLRALEVRDYIIIQRGFHADYTVFLPLEKLRNVLAEKEEKYAKQ